MTDNDALRNHPPRSSFPSPSDHRAKTSSKTHVIAPTTTSQTAHFLHATYTYQWTRAHRDDSTGVIEVTPHSRVYHFRTDRRVPRMGLLQVGWGGNNGSTVTAAIVANREGIHWERRTGHAYPNYYGSLTQSATVYVGIGDDGEPVTVPWSSVVPMVHPNDLVLGGWDISSAHLADAMDRAQVLDVDLRRQLRPLLGEMHPWPAAFDPTFIAKNQIPRANHVLSGGKQEQLDQLRANIRQFREQHRLGSIVVVWNGNSERYSEPSDEVNNDAEALLGAIARNDAHVSPSTLYAVAAILEDCPYVNGSPQNTLLPSVIELARRHKVTVCGDDFKSGQTRLKSVLADYLIGCGIKLQTAVTYNHLGNNDMFQLTDGTMWQPKSASKSSVLDRIADSNPILYSKGERPDHVVVVKYVPFLGDSKRDISEYTSEAFMGAPYTSILHNECLDSILCAPLAIDTAILCELFTRVSYRIDSHAEFVPMEPAMSVLGFFMKNPRTPTGETVVHALHRQQTCLENMLRALIGLPVESHLALDTKCPPR